MSQGEMSRAGPAGRYELRQKIGEGGAGTVYKAWDTQLQRFVAFKRLKVQDLGDSTSLMLKEAMTLASIQHPNILTIFDCGEDTDSTFVVTEYLEGEPLDKHSRHVRFNTQTIGELITQTLEGLIAAHHVHIIHRDIKPSNIMVVTLPSGARQYKILDFGLARILTQPTAQTMYDHNSIVGTVYCLAPEQIKHRPLDERTDIYAMGCVYYFMLAGKSAFQGESIVDVITAHLEHHFVPLHEIRPDIPIELCNWIEKLMSFDPADRPSSAKIALDQFNQVQSQMEPSGDIRSTSSHEIHDQSHPEDFVMGEPTQHITILPETRSTRPIVLASSLFAVVVLVAGIIFIRPPWHDQGDVIAPEPPVVAAPAMPPVQPPLVEPPAASPTISMPDYFSDMDRPEVLRAYFDQIKDLDFKFGNLGSVGEAIALITFQAQYANDPNIECLSGLHYEGLDGNTAGELDLVILRRDTKQAIAVYEVKVSDNLTLNLSQSRSQLRRFEGHVKTQAITRFHYPADDSRNFRTEQFEQVEKFGTIGSRGAAELGYDVELDISRAEAAQLQKALIRYKKLRKESSHQERTRNPPTEIRTQGNGIQSTKPINRLTCGVQAAPARY